MPVAMLDLGAVSRFRDALREEFREHWGQRRFPTRLNRYRIATAYLLDEARRRGRPLAVCEIGAGRGLLPQMCRSTMSYLGLARERVIASWTGVDLDVSRVERDPNYTRLEERNIEVGQPPGEHDAYVLLHVAEHLYEPEAALARLVASAPRGAIFVLGVPSHPHLFARWCEGRLRRERRRNGHVSAFSRMRMLRLVRGLGLAVMDERAGYLLRASGLLCEDSRWWQGANFWLGQMLPGFPGEYYLCARKPWSG
ncbi:MAG: methyltransferase domain-containing protein [Pirellulaceae bacterium]|nr:methyltransferase domain-containing protein [Pirellulaceae bacterium]